MTYLKITGWIFCTFEESNQNLYVKNMFNFVKIITILQIKKGKFVHLKKAGEGISQKVVTTKPNKNK